MTYAHTSKAIAILTACIMTLSAFGMGNTPLHRAAAGYSICSRLKLRRLLAEQRDVDVRNRNEQTPLQLAVLSGRTGAVHALLDAGADANAADRDGRTPLHIAARNGQQEIARLLVAAGADTNALTQDQLAPLQLAAREGHPQLTRLLLEHRADPLRRVAEMMSPLECALRGNHHETVGILDAWEEKLIQDESAVRCSFCLRIHWASDPHLIPFPACHDHPLCQSCLDSLVARAAARGDEVTIPCPSCRAEYCIAQPQ